jgi:hypothetical protein
VVAKVVERPAFSPPGPGDNFERWAANHISQLLEVFQQYGYRLNRAPTAEEVGADVWNFENMPLVDGRPITDGHVIGATDPRQGNFTTLDLQTGVANAVPAQLLRGGVDGNVNVLRAHVQRTTSVSTSSTIIMNASSFHNGGLALVHGRLASDLNGVVFLDLVLHRAIGGATVIQSGTVNGAPAGRTYTSSGGNRELMLAMASGTYNVSVSYLRAG